MSASSLPAMEAGHAFPVEMVDRHLDEVLKASGAALRHYSLSGNIQKMRKAMVDAMLAAREAK